MDVANPYAGRLQQQDDDFRKAPVAGMKNSVPPGDYQAVINRFDYIDTKHGLQLKTEMSVAVGDQTGAELETWHKLEDPDSFKYLKGHLQSLGVEIPQSLAELDGALRGALDAPVHVAVVEKDGYRNVYVRQRLGSALRPEPTTPSADYPAAEPTPDENLPF